MKSPLPRGETTTTTTTTAIAIKDVWQDNLETEMAAIRELILKYPFVAMDTEFPGVVARPLGTFRSPADFAYQALRCNVDLLKIIQLGITLADEEGHVPPNVSTWQFNFKFNLEYVNINGNLSLFL